MPVTQRSYDNAPLLVQQVGGLAMSLWMTEANEIDVGHVAKMQAEVERLREENDDLRRDFVTVEHHNETEAEVERLREAVEDALSGDPLRRHSARKALDKDRSVD